MGQSLQVVRTKILLEMAKKERWQGVLSSQGLCLKCTESSKSRTGRQLLNRKPEVVCGKNRKLVNL